MVAFNEFSLLFAVNCQLRVYQLALLNIGAEHPPRRGLSKFGASRPKREPQLYQHGTVRQSANDPPERPLPNLVVYLLCTRRFGVER
jgi:hypothetical protein